MRSNSLILASILIAAGASAQDHKAYFVGKLLEMNSVECGSNKPASNPTQNSGSVQQNPSSLCQEYVLETDEVTYRIVSGKTKHPELLPVGEDVRFRLQNGKMHLLVPALDSPALNSKEREYMVLSMTPRGERAADAAPIHLNHLQ